MSGSISLELLGQMIQRLIDGQAMLRADVRQLRRKADRIEALLADIARGLAGGPKDDVP